MADNQESVTLSAETMAFVDGLRKLGIGKSKSAVIRYLVEEAVKQLIREDFVNKHLAAKRTFDKLT